MDPTVGSLQLRFLTGLSAADRQRQIGHTTYERIRVYDRGEISISTAKRNNGSGYRQPKLTCDLSASMGSELRGIVAVHDDEQRL